MGSFPYPMAGRRRGITTAKSSTSTTIPSRPAGSTPGTGGARAGRRRGPGGRWARSGGTGGARRGSPLGTGKGGAGEAPACSRAHCALLLTGTATDLFLSLWRELVLGRGGREGEACRVPPGAAGGCWHLGSSRQVPKFASLSQTAGSSPSLSPGRCGAGPPPRSWLAEHPGRRALPCAPLPRPARSPVRGCRGRSRGCRRPHVLARPQRAQICSALGSRGLACLLPVPGLSSVKLPWRCFSE